MSLALPCPVPAPPRPGRPPPLAAPSLTAAAANKARLLLERCLQRLCKTYSAEAGVEVTDAAAIPEAWQKEELCLDGPTLNHLLGELGRGG